jgi:FlaG/FlaF family flagellin (archaellin)
VTTPQGVQVTIPATDNDYIPVNSTGQFDQPSHGVVSIGVHGVEYTPTADFC